MKRDINWRSFSEPVPLNQQCLFLLDVYPRPTLCIGKHVNKKSGPMVLDAFGVYWEYGKILKWCYYNTE